MKACATAASGERPASNSGRHASQSMSPSSTESRTSRRLIRIAAITCCCQLDHGCGIICSSKCVHRPLKASAVFKVLREQAPANDQGSELFLTAGCGELSSPPAQLHVNRIASSQTSPGRTHIDRDRSGTFHAVHAFIYSWVADSSCRSIS